MRLSALYKILAFLSLILIIVFFPKNEPKIKPNLVDNCMHCHKDYGSLDKAHPIEVFGCASCHGGNPNSLDKNEAHKNMVISVGRLEHAAIFCKNCHEDSIKRINLSPMQSQKGIKDVLIYQWSQKSTSNLSEDYLKDLAINHYEKGCASCHINQDENIFLDKNAKKGGGCSACHKSPTKSPNKHSNFTSQIPSQNCLKCHNRSNRIGLSYFGKFESEGYGTPYKNGKLNNRLDNIRYYYELPADIHHSKLELDCIDCHTNKGVMGDGKVHNNMEEAKDIVCKDCHEPKFAKPDKMAKKLFSINENIPENENIAYTFAKNTPLYNLQKFNDEMKFFRKKDGKSFEFTKMSDAPYHSLKIHSRLDCSACHSKWTPSCYGCHEVYFDKGKQYNWTKSKVTKGNWQEYRTFLRYELPSLGVGYNKKIMPFAPGCQVVGTIFKDEKIESFHAMAMAGWDPHTTSKESRTCIDCHFNPASLGLGRGNLDIKNGKILFSPYYDSNASGQAFSYPIDAFVSVEGKQFQSTSRKNARSFNKLELEKIINAYKCIICHRSWNDKIYENYEISLKKFKEGKTKCEF